MISVDYKLNHMDKYLRLGDEYQNSKKEGLVRELLNSADTKTDLE